MLHIIICPAYVNGKRLHGRFVATVAGRQLCTSREPLLAASRILLSEGVDPETPIATRHALPRSARRVFAAIERTIGDGSSASVSYTDFRLDLPISELGLPAGRRQRADRA